MLWGVQANHFRKDLRQRGFQYLAHSIDLTMETLRKDWFHKTADKEALKQLAPDFTKASMRFGVVHGLPHVDVPKIFFGINGLVHRKLYGWNRIKGRSITAIHASGTHMGMGAAGSLVHGTTQGHADLPKTASAPAQMLEHAGADDHHPSERTPDLWVAGIPQRLANEASLREVFEQFGRVWLIYFRAKPDRKDVPRSWCLPTACALCPTVFKRPVMLTSLLGCFLRCYVTFDGEAPERQASVGHAVSHAVRMSEPGSSKTHLLRVELASKDKSRHNSASIWDQMSHVSASRALKMANSAISANTIEEAKELLYEICFTALNARYAEMHEHQLIDIKTLHRLQESIKKGQVTTPPLADDLS